MSLKAIFYERFNENCDEFFKDLTISYPHIDQFRQLRSGLNLIKNLDQKKPQQIFNTYVGDKFRDQILSKDEGFFLTTDKIEIMKSDNGREYWVNFISYIRQIWTTLTVENKDIIWRYFHVLLVLSDKCK
jgi:hypothetical protein